MSKKLTPWFVNGELPARPGVYNVSCRKYAQTGSYWARWGEGMWYRAETTMHNAALTRSPTRVTNRWSTEGSWRGLASDPARKS